jgi:hypothetical protein
MRLERERPSEEILDLQWYTVKRAIRKHECKIENAPAGI